LNAKPDRGLQNPTCAGATSLFLLCTFLAALYDPATKLFSNFGSMLARSESPRVEQDGSLAIKTDN